MFYHYLSTSISLDECDYYRYISHFIINVINNDEEIYFAIYPLKKFPDESNYFDIGDLTWQVILPDVLIIFNVFFSRFSNFVLNGQRYVDYVLFSFFCFLFSFSFLIPFSFLFFRSFKLF